MSNTLTIPTNKTIFALHSKITKADWLEDGFPAGRMLWFRVPERAGPFTGFGIGAQPVVFGRPNKYAECHGIRDSRLVYWGLK